MTNFNTEPYNDDFSEDKKFLKILFKPGRAVQTRELNQLQSIIQNQIKRQGDHIFKEGSMVIPGHISFNKVKYVKLKSTNSQGTQVNSIIETFIGKHINAANGVTAKVIFATKSSGSDPATLFIKYTKSATANTSIKTFSANEELEIVNPELIPELDLSVSVVAASPIGNASLATIKKGVYYVKGYFVLVEDQTIVLNKYNNTPSYKIGLSITESIITAKDDESLLDNSQNTPNYSAPGADRYGIDLNLVKYAISSKPTNFIELLRVSSGKVVKKVDSTSYNVIEKALSKRMYDAMGDYVINGLSISIKENRDNNRGVWKQSTVYKYGDIVTSEGKTYVCRTLAGGTSGSVTPNIAPEIYGVKFDGVLTWKYAKLPNYNYGVSLSGDESKISLVISPGKAYIKGVEISKIASSFITLDKARTIAAKNNAIVSTDNSFGNYVFVKNIISTPSIGDFATLNLRNAANANLYTCKVRGMERHSGTGADTICKLYIFDVAVHADNTSGAPLSSVTKIVQAIGDFTCDVHTTPIIKNFTIQEPNNNSLLFMLPYKRVQSVPNSEISYCVVRRLTYDVGASRSVTATLPVDVSTGSFENPDNDKNYIIVGFGDSPYTSDGKILSGYSITRTNSNKSLIVGNIPDNVDSIAILATIRKAGGVLQSKTVSLITQEFTTAALVRKRIITLSKADGIRLVSVMMDPDGFEKDSPATYDYTLDITDRYTLDNGQRQTHYGLSKLKLSGSSGVPSGPIKVTYEYFQHSAGDYFSVNSYSSIAYNEIPSFQGVRLSDVIDFRPRQNSSGGFDFASIPKEGEDIFADFNYYLSRKAKLFLDEMGRFKISDGDPARSPVEPQSFVDCIHLCNIDVNAYTLGARDIKITNIDNRGYTMSDIRALETRIDNLEYYTALNALEQKTASQFISDSSGNERFKNGFVVDNFSTLLVKDSENLDNRSFINTKTGVLRAPMPKSQIHLKYLGEDSQSKIATLDKAQDVLLVSQPYASGEEQVNPNDNDEVQISSDMEIFPSNDDWYDEATSSDIITARSSDSNKWDLYVSLGYDFDKAGISKPQFDRWMEDAPYALNDYGAWVQSGTTMSYTSWVLGNPSAASSKVYTRLLTEAYSDNPIESDAVTAQSEIRPYLYPRVLSIRAKGLKPSETYNAHIDNKLIQDENVVPYAIIRGIRTNTKPQFDLSSIPPNGEADEAGRLYRDGSDVYVEAFSRGDLLNITGSGVLMCTYVVIDVWTEGVVTCLKVVNKQKKYGVGSTKIRGGWVATGSISGGIMTINALSEGDDEDSATLKEIKTNAKGEVAFVVKLPDGLEKSNKTITLRNDDGTSTASAIYYGSGNADNVIENDQIDASSLTDDDAGIQVNTTQRFSNDTAWNAPLAQTFLIDIDGGCFLSKVELFFKVKSSQEPITLSVHRTVNGYPGKFILPFSRVTKNASDVSISLDASVATTFEFNHPVYVEDNTEYCIVLRSNSTDYSVFLGSTEGVDRDGTQISKQPLVGTLYKQQNSASTTWSKDASHDLKFNIHRAQFNTANKTIPLGNVILNRKKLKENPLQFIKGSSYIRVYNSNHDLNVGDTVRLDTGITTGSISGIPVAQINATHTVIKPQLDSFLIKVVTSASGSGTFGGINVVCSRNFAYSMIIPKIKSRKLPGTNIAYNFYSTENLRVASISSSYVNVVNNKINSLESMKKVIGSYPNSRAAVSSKIVCTLSGDSARPWLTPVVSLENANIVLMSNKINAPTLDSVMQPNFDPKEWVVGDPYLAGEYVYYLDNVYKVKNNLTATQAQNPVASTVNYLSIGPHVPFYVSDAEETGTSTYANYITKEFSFANPSDFIKIMFSANVQRPSSVELYYRVLKTGATGDINDQKWIKVDISKKIDSTVWGVNFVVDSPVVTVEAGNVNFSDVSCYVDYPENVFTFESLQIKLALKSSNRLVSPRIKDLRIIACRSA